MPVVFVHGVNVRKDDDYEKNVASRNALIQRLVLNPLTQRDPRYGSVKIVNPYWGDLGVDFAWGEETIPKVSVLESLGPGAAGGVTAADLEFMGTVGQLTPAASPLERLGVEGTVLKSAAARDPLRFLESVVARAALSEVSLKVRESETPAQEGLRQALLIEAVRDVARDPGIAALIASAGDDADLMAKLEAAVTRRCEELLTSQIPSAALQPGMRPALETLGGGLTFRDRLGELFDRARSAPARVASSAVLSAYRGQITKSVTRFLGDVFVYLQKRDWTVQAGSILGFIRDAIHDARQQEPPDSPFLLITHSMGGNILYDLFTYYEPTLGVDLWASVAAQVGMLEEMKLFKVSNPSIKSPAKVSLPGFKTRVKKWVNIYDPDDVLSFLAQPVFADADADLPFSSGVGVFDAHGAYFQRASFFELLLAQVN
jgi:hypothetical protein